MERFWSETNMGKTEVSHAECHKAHEGGKVDGCQEFLSVGEALYCSVCGCHMNYHRKVAKYTTEVVYTECHKNHRDGVGSSYKDGCKEFVPGGLYDAVCAACGCHKSFHRNEVTKEMGMNTEGPNPAVEKSPRYPLAGRVDATRHVSMS